MSNLNPDAPEFYPGVATVTKDGSSVVLEAIRCANTFPIGSAWGSYSSYSTFNIITTNFGKNVLKKSNKIFEIQGVNTKIHSFDEEAQMEKIIEGNDNMLENVNICIDTVAGIRQEKPIYAPIVNNANNTKVASWNASPVITKVQVGSVALLAAKNITRPQLTFKDPVDNSADKLWMPKIKEKPNSRKPLALTTDYDERGVALGFRHPYEIELDLYKPPDCFLIPDESPPEFPAPLSDTKLTHVSTEQELDELTKHLETVKELAVDVEHHSYRTYQGITCLIQISTDEGGDFIIDTFTLRDHLHKLNQAFTDPKILKVFHGADKDIIWLQRDHGVYVVGMFDTYQAAKLLGLSSLSLKSLVSKYCQINIDKKFQLADWRIRPLPAELSEYARSDTHYLLYIWRKLKQDLLNAGNGQPHLLLSVFTRSTDVCAQTYVKPVLTDNAHMSLYYASKRVFDSRQLNALKMLFQWRDNQARLEDESTAYVLPNHMILHMAEVLPREVQGVLACCNPVPPLVRQNLNTIHRIILSCREQVIIPKVLDMPQSISALANIIQPPTVNGPHDFSHLSDFRDDLPTIMNGLLEYGTPIVPVQYNAKLDIFNTPPASPPSHHNEMDILSITNTYLSPYERYKMYRQYAQVQELIEYEKQQAKIAALNVENALPKSNAIIITKPPTAIEPKVSNSKKTNLVDVAEISEDEEENEAEPTEVIDLDSYTPKKNFTAPKSNNGGNDSKGNKNRKRNHSLNNTLEKVMQNDAPNGRDNLPSAQKKRNEGKKQNKWKGVVVNKAKNEPSFQPYNYNNSDDVYQKFRRGCTSKAKYSKSKFKSKGKQNFANQNKRS